jgi:hypothetical protein
MPPKRVSRLPKSHTTPRSQSHCVKGHSMDDAYISYNKFGGIRRRCATCQKEAVRAVHQRRLRTDPIYAAARRVGWEAMKAAQQAEAARLRAIRDAAQRAAKRVVNA